MNISVSFVYHWENGGTWWSKYTVSQKSKPLDV